MIMTLLRESTHEQHLRVEALMPVMEEDLDLPRYAALLRQLYGLYLPLECTLKTLDLPASFELERRLKSPALARDLGSLGVPLPEARPDRVLAGLTSTAHGVGSLYVLEGATLGGQLIARHLQRQLGLNAEHGAAFFSSYGAEVGPMWKSFRAAVEAYTATADDAPAILMGATRTFSVFEAQLAALKAGA